MATHKQVKYLMVVVCRATGKTLWENDKFEADRKYEDDFLQSDYAKRCYLADIYRDAKAMLRLRHKQWYMDAVEV